MVLLLLGRAAIAVWEGGRSQEEERFRLHKINVGIGIKYAKLDLLQLTKRPQTTKQP